MTLATRPASIPIESKPYEGFGGTLELWSSRDSEVLIAGPSGTGKSRACLEKLNLMAMKYPGFRGLLARKTRESLTNSAIVTMERDVLVAKDAYWVASQGAWKYKNGSRIVVVGMDKQGKIMSSEYDAVYVQEATELTEGDWEHLLTRVRGQVMPYQQMIACCNPAGPNHWLKRRCESGKMRLIDSRHEDNPVLFNHMKEEYTNFGRNYLSKLDALTGVRYQRLRLGRWVQAEGIVYEEWDANIHMVNRFRPPAHWRRVWGIDFGFTHPFVFQAWAIDDDGRAYRFAELYHTQLLIRDAARLILEWMQRFGEDFPEAIVCDHDAEGRAQLKEELGVPTVAAKKSVSIGIQAEKQRLRVMPDGQPRLFYMRDVGIKRDEALYDSKQPTCSEEEVELYVWQDGVKDSVPIKANDHGMDTTRYVVMYLDKGGWSLEEIAAFGRGESTVRKPVGEQEQPLPIAARSSMPQELVEPEEETEEERHRKHEEEVAAKQEADLMRARGFI